MTEQTSENIFKTRICSFDFLNVYAWPTLFDEMSFLINELTKTHFCIASKRDTGL